jgi:hypothetical protein
MKRTWLLAVLLLTGSVAWMFSGCSDSKSTQSNLTPLDSTSADIVSNNVSQPMIEMSGEDAGNLIDLVNSIPLALAAPSNLSAVPIGGHHYDTLLHTYETGWHVFYYTYNRVDTVYHGDTAVIHSGSVHGWDSARIWFAGQPVQFRGQADSVEAHGHGYLHAWDSRANEILGARHRVLRVEGDPWAQPITQLVLNGNSTDTLHAIHHPRLDATCEADNYYTGTMRNVTLDSAAIYGDGCPSSGSMSFSANVSLLCTGNAGLDSLNVDGSWSVSVTFNGATQTRSFSNGLASAVRVDSCGSAPMMSPFRFNR